MRATILRVLGRHQLDRIEGAVAEVQALNRDINQRAVAAEEQLERTRAEVGHLRTNLEALHDELATAEVALAAIVRQVAWIGGMEPASNTPLVSVIMPTWQRASLIGTALRSIQAQTYLNWECLVVDDGSDDGTDSVMVEFLKDARIKYSWIPHSGASVARNHALDQATGQLIAYLDTDNTWHPTHLAHLVWALERNPEAAWSVSGQLITGERSGRVRVRDDRNAIEALLDQNNCDLNAVAHRRSVLADVGRFDPALARMSDWDLVHRLAAQSAPAWVDAVTGVYDTSGRDRISATVPGHRFAYQVRDRYRGCPAAGLRVLFAEWHFPQVTETYITALISGLRRLGAEIEVWSEADVAVATPSPVPTHRGRLEDAIDAVQPHLVVTHWANMGVAYSPIIQSLGLPHVVRVHGFEYTPDRVAELLEAGALVHSFPHLVEPSWAGHPRLVTAPTCFDDDRFHPAAEKDRHLVLRTAAGLRTKDIETFLRVANLCPEHRFVLVLGHSLGLEAVTEELIDLRDRLGSRAEILVDVQPDAVAALMAKAGIYLHTHGTDHPVSMPISIAEAMATGSWVLGRDLPGLADYIGRGGNLYGGDTPEQRAAEAAALINASTRWSDAVWQQRAAAAVDQAFERHAAIDVADQMLRSWRRELSLPSRMDR